MIGVRDGGPDEASQPGSTPEALSLAALPPPRLPGRATAYAWCCGAVALAVAALGLAAARQDDPATAAAGLVSLVVSVLLGPLVRHVRLQRLRADGRYRTAADDGLAPALAAALRQAGVAGVTVRYGAVHGFARNFRSGSHAVVLVHERLPTRPDLLAFFVAHECAHVARYDSLRRPTVLSSVLVCVYAAALISPAAAVVAVPAGLLLVALFNHTMELDCDRLALRWTGLGAARRAAAALEAARNATPRSPLRTIRTLLTYPSPGRRLAAMDAASRS